MSEDGLRLSAKKYRKRSVIDGLLAPIQRFMEVEASSGILLLLCTIIALIFANTSLANWYHSFWQVTISLAWSDSAAQMSILQLINDGLMTVFFFVVGLEIKREFVAGDFRQARSAVLPVVAAIGGMIIPALIYFFWEKEGPGRAGWGIPMATDIAFVVGFLSLLGNRVPHGLKLLLLSLAIVDDLGAVLIIAFCYTQELSLLSLFWAAFGIGLIVLAQRLGVRRVSVYALMGIGVWVAVLRSGVHPTVAGVILGLMTPSRATIAETGLFDFLRSLFEMRRRKMTIDGTVLLELDRVTREAVSPLERLEDRLHPWVAFLIMPLFALANAGVAVELNALKTSTTWAVALGLLIGKPVGIVGLSWIAVRLRLARLPDGVDWKVMVGAGMLAGIGFTMAIFIATLAVEGRLLEAAKVGTLLGSCVSACFGLALLNNALTNPQKPEGAPASPPVS